MATVAHQIVEAIAGQLRAAATPAAGRVFTGRGWALDDADLPALVVARGDEEIEPLTIHQPTPQLHRLEVFVSCKVRAVDALDAAMDALLAPALDALFADPASWLAPSIGLQERARRPGLTRTGEAAVGEVEIELAAVFSTMSNAAEAIAA